MNSTVMTRGKLVGGAALAAALLLSGCTAQAGASDSQSTADGGADSGSDLLMPEGEGQTQYPMTLETPWGSSEITERPQRIAAITPSQDDLEILGALDVAPVISTDRDLNAWMEDQLPTTIEAQFTAGDDQFPAEEIALAEPDLIIALGVDLGDQYDRLSSIAPVLATEAQTGTGERVANDWESNMRTVGEALDLQDAAEAALETEESSFEAFRTDYPEFEDLTVSYIVDYGEEVGLQYHSSEGSPAATTLERMGFAASNPNAKDLGYREVVSREMLSTIDADIIVFSGQIGEDPADILEDPLFQKLDAVENEQVVLIENKNESFVIDGEEHDGNLPWALARSGPLSSPWAADKLAPAISAVLAD
jgi:iron complex transport system substrate-binding protein